MNRKTSLLLGYARRMQQVAQLATEMKDIQATYAREFGDWTTGDLAEVLTGQRLAEMHSRLAPSVHPEPAQEPADNVLEPVSDTPPGAPALGLAPAPGWVLESPLRHFHGGTECDQAWADCLIARGETEVPGV